MSLNSPAVCVLRPTMKTLTLFYFKQRLSDKGSVSTVTDDGPFQGWSLHIHCICHADMGPKPYALPRFNRIEAAADAILKVVPRNAVIGLEGYSFSSMPTEADTTLKELGSLLRMGLCKLDPVSIRELPPTSVKKEWSRSGRADKCEMYAAYVRYGLPLLEPLLGMKPSKVGCKTLRHPIDDLVDSIAVAVTALAHGAT